MVFTFFATRVFFTPLFLALTLLPFANLEQANNARSCAVCCSIVDAKHINAYGIS
jgi:hypothetical protein